jgi:hypothetical protein
MHYSIHFQSWRSGILLDFLLFILYLICLSNQIAIIKIYVRSPFRKVNYNLTPALSYRRGSSPSPLEPVPHQREEGVRG